MKTTTNTQTTTNATMLNFTPHTLNVVKLEDNKLTPILTLESEGVPIRISQEEILVGNINGIETFKTVYGETTGLPEQRENTFLIVSRMVIDANPTRTDLLCPSKIVRQDSDGNFSTDFRCRGNIVGCLGLSY